MMNKESLLSILIILGLLIGAVILFYPLFYPNTVDSHLLMIKLVEAFGVLLLVVGLIMVLPRKFLITFLAFFSSESALGQQQMGFPGYSRNYTFFLSDLFKLNTYPWSKPLGLILTVLGLILVFKY